MIVVAVTITHRPHYRRSTTSINTVTRRVQVLLSPSSPSADPWGRYLASDPKGEVYVSVRVCGSEGGGRGRHTMTPQGPTASATIAPASWGSAGNVTQRQRGGGQGGPRTSQAAGGHRWCGPPPEVETLQTSARCPRAPSWQTRHKTTAHSRPGHTQAQGRGKNHTQRHRDNHGSKGASREIENTGR
jgi:hypothetical protein